MAAIPFRERLERGTILVDGAMGTMLHALRRLPLDICFDLLNADDPELVKEIHRRYIQAGAEVIETNTFSANRYKLAACSAQDRCAELNRAGVRLAQEAIAELGRDDVYVAGSVGPLGVRLAPYGRITPEEARAAFREQVGALIEAGADVLIFETFTDLYEIAEAVGAARDVDADVPVIAQMTFTRDDRTVLGDTPAQVARTLAETGADVIGVNCSGGPAQLLRILQLMRRAVPDARYSVLPNAGWPEMVGGRVCGGRLLRHDAGAHPRHARGARRPRASPSDAGRGQRPRVLRSQRDAGAPHQARAKAGGGAIRGQRGNAAAAQLHRAESDRLGGAFARGGRGLHQRLR